LCLSILVLGLTPHKASALEPITIDENSTAIDLTKVLQFYRGDGNKLQVTTAPDQDGVVRRIEVRATEKEGQAAENWAVFALANTSDKQIDRLIVAPHYKLANSGLFWPHLGSVRIVSITPSEGFSLERLDSENADVFSITLDPNTIITFVAELNTPELFDITMWEPNAYKDTINSYTLYRGIVLGIAGLLAVFLTVLFVIKGSAVFPATAALAWAILAYVCIDFGFWEKIITIAAADKPFWRATSETGIAVTLAVFLYIYLNLDRWHEYSKFSTPLVAIIAGGMLGLAYFSPEMASGFARILIALTGAIGAFFIIGLSIKRYDRAVMLIPIWLLLLAWISITFLTIIGSLDNDVIQSALTGGLVMIILLIGFTVMQNAFTGGPLSQGLISDKERRAFANIGAGNIVWDWDVIRDNIFISEEISGILNMPQNSLTGSPQKWLSSLHPADRDRFKTTLDLMLEHRKGRITQEFRLRSKDGHYHNFSLRARPVLNKESIVVRCIGTLSDVTEARLTEQRLQHDAIYDILTGLPNRELFIDRLDALIKSYTQERPINPTVFIIDIDQFKDINEQYGISVGDSIMLTASRRLNRLIKPKDTLARLRGAQFGLIITSIADSVEIAKFAETLKKTLKSPINFSDKEIVLSSSIGLSNISQEQDTANDVIQNAEIALLHAKRGGGNKIEPFRPNFRNLKEDIVSLENQLESAITNGELVMHYQPIIDIKNRRIAGFEALMRWQHPLRGLIMPTEFIPIAERLGLTTNIGKLAIMESVQQLSKWFQLLNNQQLFMSVNASSQQVLHQNLVTDMKSAMLKFQVPAERIKLEITESIVMKNSEQASFVISQLKDLGISLTLDDFGTGYSALSYLMRYPFDTLKIDRSLIQENNNAEKPVILHSIVKMAHDLGMVVIAEGPESAQDVRYIVESECDFTQGYFYGRPENAATTTKLLRKHFGLDEKKKA
jgi:diguanylate cyclase (GGDEF)-like protein